MSHFTVLVSAKNDEELAAKLQPFHEYECTGIEDQYVVEVDVTDRVKEDYQKYGEGESLAEFAKEWGNYTERNGRFYDYTNPNAKWDWWKIGGRWTGKLKLKMPNMGRNGSPGLMTEPNTNPNYADVALAGDVDWQGIHDESVQRELESYKLRHHYIALAEKADIPEEYYQDAEKQFQENEYAQKVGSPHKLALYGMASSLMRLDSHFILDSYSDIAAYMNMDEKQYKISVSGKAQTYAFIDLDGNWQQRGKMGWFGMDDKSQGTDNYDEAWWQFVKSIPADQLVYVVDCHI